MAETQSLVDQGVDRVQDAIKSVDKELQRLQREVRTRRRSFERNLETRRRSIEKQAQKQIKALRENDLVKRVETFGSDVQEQIGSRVGSVLSIFQIASKGDIERVDRKIERITKKLKDLETPSQA
jgi:gas vesicle protein